VNYFAKKGHSVLLHKITRLQPVDFRLERGPILADWILPDLTDEESIERVERHKRALDPYWSEFVDHHRILFMNSISSRSQEEMEKLFGSMNSWMISKKDAVRNLHFHFGYSASEFLFDNYDILESFPFTAISKITRERFQNRAMWENSHKLITGAPEDLRTILVERGILKDAKIVVDINGPAGLIELSYGEARNDPFLQNNSHFYHHGDGHVEVYLVDSWAKFQFDGSKFKETDHSISGYDNPLFPLLVWSKNRSQERTYLSSNVPPELLDGVDEHSNPLVGLIAGVNVSPEQRKRLGVKRGYEDVTDAHNLKIKKVGYQQSMLEPQIPVLLLMCQQFIMDNAPLFRKVEALYTPG